MHARTVVSHWSLRTRLLLSTLLIAALGIIASDLAADAALRSFLIKQVDSQLNSTLGSSLNRLDRAGIVIESDDGQVTGFVPVRPLTNIPTNLTITTLDLNGHVTGSLGGDYNSSTYPTFAGLSVTEIITRAGEPFTVHVESAPDVRAVADILPSGQGAVVVSQSLETVDKTIVKLQFYFFFITLIVLFLIVLAAAAIVRLSLRPLREIEITAAAIADGDLSARLTETTEKTEVGRLSKSLNTMLGHIERAFEARVQSENRLRRFAADASHELRTPLTAIRGFAELYRQGAVTGEEKTKELLSRIEKESIRMTGLVEDLLTLARMDQAPTVTKSPVDLTKVVHDCVVSAKAAGPDHPITVVANNETYVLGDSDRIHQAIQNLLANARVHTPANTPITVTINEDENESTITVADAGPGLAPEDQERIFERFYRADPSRARVSGEGSGLGLSIVDTIMKAHGGSVTLQSEIGKGAAFTLHFPVSDQD